MTELYIHGHSGITIAPYRSTKKKKKVHVDPYLRPKPWLSLGDELCQKQAVFQSSNPYIFSISDNTLQFLVITLSADPYKRFIQE